MPHDLSVSTGTKPSGKVKRLSIPRVQSTTDNELQSQMSQSASTPLQPLSLYCLSFRSDLEHSAIPTTVQTRLLDLFQQIQKEFELVCMENITLQEKVDGLSEKLDKECHSSGERYLLPNDNADYADKSQFKQKGTSLPVSTQKVKASNKLKAQTSKIVSSFKNPVVACSMQRQYSGHKDGIWDISIGRLGQPIISTASADHTARVIATDTGRCLLKYIGHNGSVNSVRFHPTIDLALTSSGDCSAHVWQAAVNWDLSKQQESSDDVSLDRTSMTATNDDQDEPPTLRTPVRELLGHTGAVMAADWLPGAEQLVTASWDRTSNLYDAETGEIIHTLCGHDQELTYVSTHHAQRLCVTSSCDTTFRLWDFREPIHSVSVFQGHTEAVTSAVFTREDKIVSGSDDRSIKVWELRNIRSPLATIRSDSAANRLAVSSTGIIAIPHDNRQIRLFDLCGQRLARLPRTSRQGHRRMVCSVAWSEEPGAECNLFSCGFDRLVLGWSIVPIKET